MANQYLKINWNNNNECLVPTKETLDEVIKNKIYPIGSIYISINNTDPSTIFGGSWQRFAKGKTLIGVDEDDENFDMVKKEDGNKTIKLTVNNLPSHQHVVPSHTHEATSEAAGAHVHNMNHTHSHNLSITNGGAHTHTFTGWLKTVSSNTTVYRSISNLRIDSDGAATPASMNSSGAHTHSLSGSISSISANTSKVDHHSHAISVKTASSFSTTSIGDNKEIDILPPYITVYMWVRTA